MKITKVETVYDGHYKLRVLTLHNGEKELKRERFEPGQAVAALVYDTARQQYVFVRQYRIGAEGEVDEIAAGMLDKQSESPTEGLRREIEEELGYAAVDHLEHIADVYPSPGNSAEKIGVYYAEVSRQTSAGGGVADEDENISLRYLSRAEMAAHTWQDAKTLLAVQWVLLHK